MFNPASPPPSFGKMFCTFIKLVVPAILTNLFMLMSGVIIVYFAGQLDDSIYISVVGFTFSFRSLMVYSLVVGLNAAQETLTSQAFGAGNTRLCGIYLNRGMFIQWTCLIPLAMIALVFGEMIFVAIGVDPEVSRLAVIQLRALAPAMFFEG